MSFQLTQILARLPQHRVLVVGDVMLDEYLVGESSRISAEAPVPVVRFAGRHTAPGGAANTAANVASLGGRALLLGLAGEDGAGRELARQCEASGVEFTRVVAGRPTTRKVRVISQGQQLLRLDYEDASDIDDEAAGHLLDEFDSRVTASDVVVLSDYAKGMLTGRVCGELIGRSHAAGREVIVDPRPQHAAFYDGCDYLTPNWKEAHGLVGQPEHPMTDEAIEGIGTAIGERFKSSVLLTLGSRGIAFFGVDGVERFVAPAESQEVFDVSGAGDTVVAAFALARAAGCSHAEAVELANRAAGVVVGKRGTATVSPADLIGAQVGRVR
jgi:D-beta-D-heptose 7-phosphate kinase/D-beta-D-heptose 1-phosphate adenosyltransferase